MQICCGMRYACHLYKISQGKFECVFLIQAPNLEPTGGKRECLRSSNCASSVLPEKTICITYDVRVGPGFSEATTKKVQELDRKFLDFFVVASKREISPKMALKLKALLVGQDG